MFQSGSTLFPYNSLFSQWLKLEMVHLDSVHNEFKFFSVSGTLVLGAIKMTGTVKVLGSNLTVDFFSNELFRFKKNLIVFSAFVLFA